MVVQFPFTKSVCGNLRKNGKETAVRQNGKEKRSKKPHHLKNIFLKTMHIFSRF